jgi:hypothetical protein
VNGSGGSRQGGLLGKNSISRSFAGLVFTALIVLVLLRHLTGTISIQ